MYQFLASHFELILCL